MYMANVITNRMAVGTHTYQLVPDSRSEQFLRQSIEEGKHIIKSAGIASQLIERVFRFALRESLIDLGKKFSMEPFQPVLQRIVDLEVRYTEAPVEQRKTLRQERVKAYRELLPLRREAAALFKECVNGSRYLRDFGLSPDKSSMAIFAAKPAKDSEISNESVVRLILRTPELQATEEEIMACQELIGKTAAIDGYLTSRKRLFEPKVDKKNNIFSRMIVQNMDLFKDNLVTYELNSRNEEFRAVIEEQGISYMFQIPMYASFLAQEGIDEYNAILNGRIYETAGEMQRHSFSLNRFIYEYNAKHQKEDGFVRLKAFKPLYKQVLGISKQANDDEDGRFRQIDNAEVFTEELKKWVGYFEDVDRLRYAIGLVDRLQDLSTLYIRKNALGGISRTLFGQPQELTGRLTQAGAKVQKIQVYGQKVDAYSLQALFQPGVLDREEFSDYFDNMLKAVLLDGEERERWLQEKNTAYASSAWLRVPCIPTLVRLLKNNIEQFRTRKPGPTEAGYIQRLTTAASRFTSMMNLIVEDENDTAPENPVRDLIAEQYAEMMENCHRTMTDLKGYILSKPQNTNKTPIYFGYQLFGSGWSEAKLTSSGMFIVREKTGNDKAPYYYDVCIGNRLKPKPFVIQNLYRAMQEHPKGDRMEVFHFNQITSQQAIGQVLYNPNYLKTCEGDDGIRQLLLNKETRKDVITMRDASPERKEEIMAFLKQILTTGLCAERNGFKKEMFEGIDNLSDLINVIVEEGYDCDFRPIDRDLLEEAVERGDILRFRIMTRKLYSGKENIGLAEKLFLAAMQIDLGIKIKGGVQVFYRDPKITRESTFIHPKGSYLLGKYDNDGKPLVDEKGRDCYMLLFRYLNRDLKLGSKTMTVEELVKAEKLYNEKKDKLRIRQMDRELVKCNRYTKPMWSIHIPFVANSTGVKNDDLAFKQALDKLFYEAVTADSFKVLSLVFTPRNLVYLTLTDQSGKIIEQRSLNRFYSGLADRKTDYYKIIEERNRQIRYIKSDLEANVRNAQSSWNTADQIKGLVDSYIGYVAQEVARYMIAGDTILVMEDLRKGKQGTMFDQATLRAAQRQIIDKLACLRLRHIPLDQPGSTIKPISLCRKIQKADECIFRNGLVLIPGQDYLNSRVDPYTGYVNLLPNLSDMTVKQCKELLMSFDSIRYDKKTKLFRISYTPSRLKVPKGKMKVETDREMTFTTREDSRFVFNGRTESGEPIIEVWDNITDRIIDLLQTAGITYADGEDILPRLERFQGRSNPYKPLLGILRTLLRLDNYTFADPDNEAFISPWEGGKSIHEKDAIDKTMGYVLALRGLAYIQGYKRKLDEQDERNLACPEANQITVEDYVTFFRYHAGQR